MSITVYSKPACSQCDATYRALDRKGLEYDKIDISQDQDAFDYVLAQGAQSAPFVEVTHDDGSVISWSGFNPDGILSLR